MIKSLVSVLLGASVVLGPMASARADDSSSSDFMGVPCSQIINGIAYCGEHDIEIPAAPSGSYNGTPLPVIQTAVTLEVNGYKMTTDSFHAHVAVYGTPSTKIEQLPDGTLTQAYYDRLNAQLCDAKPVLCGS